MTKFSIYIVQKMFGCFDIEKYYENLEAKLNNLFNRILYFLLSIEEETRQGSPVLTDLVRA